MIDVTLAEEGDRQDWESYLDRAQPDHHAFCWQWRSVLKEAFGHTPYYYLARDDSRCVCGVLPLYHVKSMLFGSALISVPYLNGGGILADSGEVFSALLRRAAASAEELGVAYLELRSRRALGDSHGLIERSHKVSMVLPLSEDHEKLFASFKPKLRAQIKRPSKSGIHAEVSECGISAERSLEAFYAVFAEHMRDLGTPVFPKRLFSGAKHSFGATCRVVTVWREGSPIAAGITLRHRDRVEIPWAAALKRFNRESPNMLLYWQAMKTACLDGAVTFDFGRSSYDSGPHRFKEQWGSQPVPLYWYYRVLRGKVPDITPGNPKFAVLVNCWRRMPLLVTNALGPLVTRSLP
jgi:FemAB-related protein (PEP-CTERM system-associated)